MRKPGELLPFYEKLNKDGEWITTRCFTRVDRKPKKKSAP